MNDEHLPQRCKDAVAAATLDMWQDQQIIMAANARLQQQLDPVRGIWKAWQLYAASGDTAYRNINQWITATYLPEELANALNVDSRNET